MSTTNEQTESQQAPSLREKIRRLRTTFVGKLPQMLQDIYSLCDRLSGDPANDALLADLYRMFHSIKGTSASFGLKAISQEADLAEALVQRLQAKPGNVRGGLMLQLKPEFQAVVARLESLMEEAEQAGLEEKTAVTTSFDMSTPVHKTNRKKIYICDDDALQAEQLGEQLACFGYNPSIFTEPDELRAAVLTMQPAAIVMDIVFPVGASTGTELISELQREIRLRIPVVFMSSRNDFQARLDAVRAGGEAYFTKPMRAIDVVETLDTMTNNRDPEPYRILVVDDDPEVAAYHSFILEQVGMTTRLLHEPELVLDVLADFKPDLVLMDMYMPGCGGRELSQIIRQIPEFISLPIVFLSSETNKNKQVSALRVGAEGFLTKPIQPEDLISAVAIRAERMRTLRSLMVRDGLTGLFNHSFMSQYLETALAGAQRDDGRICFVMIDVDLFKTVNDTYGHPAGDQVLVALARLLQQRLRSSDMVGRYGGEEFAIILPDTDLDEAWQIINGLREDFAAIQFQSGENDFSCTFSGGIAAYPENERSEQLREFADQALYRAKQAGRNRIFRSGD